MQFDGQDSSVCIATCYGLDGTGIVSLSERDFPHPYRPAPGPNPTSFTLDTGSIPGAKRPGSSVDHPSHLVRKLKKEYSYTFNPTLDFRGLFWG
jgi:hypothetical protein